MSDTVVESGELLHVDPATLTIGTNVRTETHTDAKQFARSIRERGVLEVITAYRDETGQLVVLRGQRRTIVATQVGTPTGTVPVRVVAAPVEGDRIVDQLAENLHRDAIGQPEVLAGIEQLSLVGLSAAQIAKRTALRRPEVDAALAVATCPTVREQVASESLTLQQAAIFVEFDGDDDATDRLHAALRRGTPLAHAAQQLRDEAAERAELLAEVERLRGEGMPVLDPDNLPGSLWRLRLEDLRDADGYPVPVESWRQVEGAAVVVTAEWVYPEATSGDEDADEPAEDADAEPERRFVPVWIVPDPAAVGLHHKYDSGQHGSGTGTDQPSDAEREAATAERRRVIAHNKAWRSVMLTEPRCPSGRRGGRRAHRPGGTPCR
jgi:ParB family chromosome partitioning protein